MEGHKRHSRRHPGGMGASGNELAPNGAFWLFSKYQVPDEILHCPGDGGVTAASAPPPASRQKVKNMRLTADGFLPEAPVDVVAETTSELMIPILRTRRGAAQVPRRSKARPSLTETVDRILTRAGSSFVSCNW